MHVKTKTLATKNRVARAWRPAVYLLLILALVVGALQVLAEGIPIQELTEPGKAFKVYQATAPPIKHMFFARSDNIKFAGMFYAEGAIQPTGYFLRYLTNSPFTTNSIVVGLDEQYAWEYDAQDASVAYGPREFETHLHTCINHFWFERLQAIACLGIRRWFAGNDNFRWISQTEFEFDHPWGHYVGHIIFFDRKNRPQELEYHSTSENSPNFRKYLLLYQYDGNNGLLPDRIIEHTFSKTSVDTITNVTISLDVGLDSHITRGYSLHDLIPQSAEIKEITFISNNVRYAVDPDGRKTLYKYPNAIVSSANPVRYSILMIVLVLFVTTAVYWVRRRGINITVHKHG